MNIFANKKNKTISDIKLIKKIFEKLTENESEIAIFIDKKYFTTINQYEPQKNEITLEFEFKPNKKELLKNKEYKIELKKNEEIYTGKVNFLDGDNLTYKFNLPTLLQIDQYNKFYRILIPPRIEAFLECFIIRKSQSLGEIFNFTIRDLSIEGATINLPNNINFPFYPGYTIKKATIKGLDKDIIVDIIFRKISTRSASVYFIYYNDKDKEYLNKNIIEIRLEQIKKQKEMKLEIQPDEQKVQKIKNELPDKEKNKEQEQKFDVRILIIDNNPDEIINKINDKFKVKLTNYDNYQIFLKIIKPQKIIINCGYLNGYKIIEDVLKITEEKNIPIFLYKKNISENFLKEILAKNKNIHYFTNEEDIQDIFNKLLN